MICFPFCKINLGLFVTEKRDDRFHNIESAFLPVPWCDSLEIEKKSTPGLELITHGLDVGPGKNNIIQKAYDALDGEPGIKCHLIKQIPHGAGLGGGSSDAAHFLKLANSMLGLGLDKTELQSMALDVGSDCPFFLEETIQYVEGRGEVFSDIDIDLKGMHLVIVHPSFPISTVEAYSHIKPDNTRSSLRELLSQPIENWNGEVVNDFEAYAMNKHAELRELKTVFEENGSVYSGMSGSGSAYFGLFKQQPDLGDFLKRGSTFHCTL